MDYIFLDRTGHDRSLRRWLEQQTLHASCVVTRHCDEPPTHRPPDGQLDDHRRIWWQVKAAPRGRLAQLDLTVETPRLGLAHCPLPDPAAQAGWQARLSGAGARPPSALPTAERAHWQRGYVMCDERIQARGEAAHYPITAPPCA